MDLKLGEPQLERPAERLAGRPAAGRAFPLTLARWIWWPLLLFLITRLGVAFVAYLAVPLIADSPTMPPYHLREPGNVLLDVFGSRWDTGFYVSIAEEGYKFRGVRFPSVAFFPLLPLAMRAATPLVGDAMVAGILVSNVALLLAAMLFYRLVDEAWGPAVAGRAVWYLLIFPASFFGSALYSESLFLLGAIGALYFARRGYWEVAALLAIATTLTRFVGLIVAPMLLVEWWMQWRSEPWRSEPWRVQRDGRRPSPLALLAPAAAPLGTAAYMFYLWRAFGDPLAFVKGAAVWERVPQSPFVTIANLFHTPAEGWWRALVAGTLPLNDWLDFILVLLFLLAGFVLLYKGRWSEGVFVLLGVLIPFSSGLLMSQRRYMWVLFPVFILLAQWGERPWLDRLVTAVSLLGLALFTALFANGYWVG